MTSTVVPSCRAISGQGGVFVTGGLRRVLLLDLLDATVPGLLEPLDLLQRSLCPRGDRCFERGQLVRRFVDGAGQRFEFRLTSEQSLPVTAGVFPNVRRRVRTK